MKCWAGLLIVILLVFCSPANCAAVRITDDPGGRIGKYIYKYQRLRASGQNVIIDGFCTSACTIVLATIPTDRICDFAGRASVPRREGYWSSRTACY
ncbi:hypothetical protein SAMN05216338_105720 [Bradyrhizobium sp. Rc2d]|nr:hypothetical protein SAMN05216338_105720 [Bradyrhizobium sp. Rc2d]